MSPSRRTLMAALLLSATTCKEAPAPQFDATSAFGYLTQQVGFGYRIPGTEGHRKTGDWIDSLLRARADTVIVQSWSHITTKGDTLELRNFLGRFKPGAAERILFLAHWDTRPIADGANSKDSTRAVPGANDGASGVALLLGVADALKHIAPSIGVDLLFVDGEDYGDFTATPADVLIGSRYYAAHQPSGPKPLFAVLFDLVADKDLQIYQEGNSLTGAPEVVDRVWEIAKDLGYGQYFIASPKHMLNDDHLELQKVGIRAIDVIDFDYEYWHTPEDTVDKVSAQSLQIVGDVALGIIRNM